MDRRTFLLVSGGTIISVISAGGFIYYLIEQSQKTEPNELPPGQVEVPSLRVLHIGSVPEFDQKTWTLEVLGLINNPLIFNYQQIRELPKIVSTSDFHCVTRWSKLANKWEGVRFKTLIEMAQVKSEVDSATIICESGYTSSLPLEDLSRDDVLLAYRLDEEDLPLIHGGPLRLIVPHKYGYKSAKWVRQIKFTSGIELGYWEQRGYSQTADPFTEDRRS
ncbi:MAG: molybdopterin-dependent oxidoreductase [Promethearchaeota archaeon]|jgi:DMSO/TMAO reductase YedYZ molybdopterin-dependent catalytic subunit